MQYKCIYCLLDWRKHVHVVVYFQQHDGLSTTRRHFKRGPDVHRTDKRKGGRTCPLLQSCRTSSGTGSFLAAHGQTAGPATACEDHCAFWCQSESGSGPWCSWGPSAEFHTWTVFCPGPTEGPLCAGDQKPCSNPASFSFLWHWQPSYVSSLFRIFLASWSRFPRTRIQSRCSFVGETSCWFWDEGLN